MVEYLVLAISLLTLFLMFLIYRQRNEISNLSRRMDEMNSNIPMIVENSVNKTFRDSSGVFESIFTSAISKNT